MFLLRIFVEQLIPEKKRKNGFGPESKLAIYLHYMRTGNYYYGVGAHALFQCTRSCVCKIINFVAFVISRRSNDFIVFPEEDEQELIADAFFDKYGISGCVGVVSFKITIKTIVIL